LVRVSARARVHLGADEIQVGMDEFLKSLNVVKGKVERHLEAFLRHKTAEATRISPGAEELIRVLSEFTLRGGKRLRAGLVYYGHRCFSGRDTEAVWNAAICMELVQSFLLIHDDVIDEDDTRRGGWTVHRHYSDLHRERYHRRDPKHFGESMAILCGDLALALANEILGRLALDTPARGTILDRMHRMVSDAIYGECMDVLSEVAAEVSEQDILGIGMLKTASYTVEGPLHMGALLGGAGSEDLERLSRYAIPLGNAFQVRDDILGLFGDAERLGKPVGSDIREGKKTLLILKALERADSDQRAFLERMLGNKDVSGEEMDGIRRLVVETGALDACNEMARKLVEEARTALLGCRWREEGVAFLEGTIEFMVERES
jgi:geranylgeranyl diphosphate synthase type I